MLAAHNIVTYREGEEVLQSLDIEVRAGSITSLIGPSGAGKTTLLNILSFSCSPTSGTLTLDNTSLSFPLQNKKLQASPTVAMVFQQLFLWPHLTLRENIMLSPKADAAEVKELISAFHMEGFIDRYPNQTSLGQRQRAALARAIALKPKYLLLDEVTSALDIEQIESVAKYLEKLRDRGVGILVVTHLIHFAQRVSDQILFMDKGTIIERGDKDLIANPKNEQTKAFLKYY
jgi:ABC-type polar amino acid transport system ATPase subunit